MTALHDRLAGRAEPGIAVGDRRCLMREDLLGQGRGAGIGPDDRVAISVTDPVTLIAMLSALDGQVAAILLISYTQPAAVVSALAEAAGCTRIVSDRDDLAPDPARPRLSPAEAIGPRGPEAAVATAWLMTTSGTTGIPKIITHSLQSLSRTVYRFAAAPGPSWGLLYDPTRFAGMQVVLQALIGGGRLIAVDTAGQTLAGQVGELARHGCTHLSATPTLWRRLLMVPEIRALPLQQVTLGGESVPQDVLDALGAAFPAARRTHIYASTEAGVGFAVNDGKAGFPESFLTTVPGGVRLRIVEGVLWLRPPGPARPAAPGIEVDAEGFICSGDLIRLDGGRGQFLGRENGLINVGGVKVYPEVVERAVAEVPGVVLVKVSSKSSPITGALVLAEVMAAPDADRPALKDAILRHCRAGLPRESVPGLIRFVDDLEINAAGKLTRRTAAGA